MKPLKLYLFGALAAVLLGIAGTNYTRTLYYCERCGMRRNQEQREWFDIPYQNTNRLYPTGYSELYFRVRPAPCQHKWTFINSRSWGNIVRGGENGCGDMPDAIRYSPILRRLRNLDNAKVPSILAILPIQARPVPPTAQERFNNFLNALTDVKDNASAAETEEWWNRHRKSFSEK